MGGRIWQNNSPCRIYDCLGLRYWRILFGFSYLFSVCLAPGVRGQHIAQTSTPASIFHAPGRSECWQQLCLRPLVQSSQLLQLLRHLHDPLRIQQPHEPSGKRALPAGQSQPALPKVCASTLHGVSPHIGGVTSTSVYQRPSPTTSRRRTCNCIWLKLEFRNSMFSKITASVGFYVRLPKPWIYFSYSKLLHL